MWRNLRMFWSLDRWDDNIAATAGRAECNILPLCPTAHRFWDLFKFTLRPIEDRADPQHRIYVQMVWLAGAGGKDGKDTTSGQWDHTTMGGFADFRRGPDANGCYAPVRHGDVYEITTTDPEHFPLPSARMLEIQFGAQSLMAGIRAAGILRDIFSGDPPYDDDDDDAVLTMDTPPEWKSLIDAAIEAGILDDSAAGRWARALTREVLWRQELVLRRYLPDEFA